MTPNEALSRAISAAFLSTHPRVPGAVVQRMSTETREALSRLTADEMSRARVPEYICRVGGRRGRASLGR